MSITCDLCFYNRNSDKNKFCEVCGSEIRLSTTLLKTQEKSIQEEEIQTAIQTDKKTVNQNKDINQNINNYFLKTPTSINKTTSKTPIIEADKKVNMTPKTAINSTLINSSIVKLIPKQIGAPIPEFIIDSNNAIIGKFNPEIGPVEIDLDGFYGDNTVSLTHAEIYFKNNQWQIKDMGSTNGIYIKHIGKTRFGYRINQPEILNSGDEIAIGKIRLLFIIS
ncbi:MAG: FHA domain-containing protein [Trichodesmium sp. St16_bin4-tuft]|nr:FHA domain-containing protein [Trichodesmium sp. MAG_R01]MDE5069358.1 FHA domain-containing protein [Trichodesmium sp. St4_bin8_1]MDE5072741.1 FHA domain-containing protein [Trichodesmium sp. St5_bin8]MDE5077839.1 FHA domain-containing protein [Trichodesmium sp. St2_bin6]MDE5091479.1 FHA domain-containing protein [Trichodesmium sp. St18_bin3_1_1]MDE5098840.1 FHA domain-containing protein [Trichodesmium sp. St16_bin4-tuft]MDE5104575.1 FHA domain-containing protein [Trichodesmium sp. St19_bi